MMADSSTWKESDTFAHCEILFEYLYTLFDSRDIPAITMWTSRQNGGNPAHLKNFESKFPVVYEIEGAEKRYF